jgi:hypothetical protein
MTIELNDVEAEALADLVYYERKDQWANVDDRNDPITVKYVFLLTNVLEKLIGHRNEDHLE